MVRTLSFLELSSIDFHSVAGHMSAEYETYSLTN